MHGVRRHPKVGWQEEWLDKERRKLSNEHNEASMGLVMEKKVYPMTSTPPVMTHAEDYSLVPKP